MSAPPIPEPRVSRLLGLVAIALAFVILASGLAAASGADGRIRGFVRDAGTAAAIAGATVRIAASDLPWVFETTTDASGYYEIVLPPHRYDLTASTAAYDLDAQNVAVGSGQLVWANLTLAPASSRSARLQGYVTDAVSSAPVTVGRILAGPPWWSTGPYANASALNGSGYFSMDLVPGYYDVQTDGTFGHDGYDYYPVILNTGQTLWYNISLSPNPLDSWINGTVFDAVTYAAIVGARVTARVNGLLLPVVTSNATGFYAMQTPSGSVELAADALGYAPASTTVYVWSTGQYSQSFALTPLSNGVRGYVRDGVTGRGIPGVNVSVDPLFSSGYYDQATTDASGYFNVALPDDYYIVSARASGYTVGSTWVFFWSSPIVWTNLTLWPIISIVAGYLVDATDGSHVPGLSVVAVDTRSGYTTSGFADGTGFFSLDVPPSPAMAIQVRGVAPYAGNLVYFGTRPYATTWLNITLDHLLAQVHATVTDAITGLTLSGASVTLTWYYGASYATANGTGQADLESPVGVTVYVYAWASGYLTWSDTLSTSVGPNTVSISLYPVLAEDVRVRGYVIDGSTSMGLWSATVEARGYDGVASSDYTDSSGYYEVWTVAAPQTVRATDSGYSAGEAPISPSPGDVLWVNLTLLPDTTAPVFRSFTATPSIGVDRATPAALLADVNETSLESAYLSILMLRSTAGNVGTFVSLGRQDPSTVTVTHPGPDTYNVSSSWDTRTPLGRLSDGVSSTWWPAVFAYAPFQAVVSGYWDNATLPSPEVGAAVFDTRSGNLLYVVTVDGFFGPNDQPSSTFSPHALGYNIDLTTAAILGSTLVTGPAFRVGSLRMDVSQGVPAGQYAALLEVWDAAGHYAQAATLMQVAPDRIPPVAAAGPDVTMNEDAAVTFDGTRSTDNLGIASYTWTFTDGTARVLQGATASYVFATPGTYVVTLTVVDADGNVGTDTLIVTVRDVTVPTLSLSAPSEGATVSGALLIQATAADNVAVVRVEFLVDGRSVGNDTAAPFELLLPTGTLGLGNHTIEAVAYDAAGNPATAVRHVTVVPGSGGGGLDTLVLGGLAVILLAIVAVLVVALVLLRRRRPRLPSSVPTASAEPSAAAPIPEEPPSPPSEDLPEIENL